MANQISSRILTGSDQFQAVLSRTSRILSGTGWILSGTDQNWSEPVGIRLVPLGTCGAQKSTGNFVKFNCSECFETVLFFLESG